MWVPAESSRRDWLLARMQIDGEGVFVLSTDLTVTERKDQDDVSGSIATIWFVGAQMLPWTAVDRAPTSTEQLSRHWHEMLVPEIYLLTASSFLLADNMCNRGVGH